MSATADKIEHSPVLRRPEILAPAGNRDMMRAAVENGADAIYFGLESFNARLRAHNFSREELPETVAWLHERGVKAYVTLNTLIFTSELTEAARVLIACSAAGVDAILVQDLGLARLAHRLVPDLPLHASTQMTLTCAESIAAVEELGLQFERIVAPRENNLRELARMAKETSREIEVFVHGAICVAYSGQCLTSEALGGRSANRGACAQACRLPYDLLVDGEPRDLDDVKYLLSPKDLAAYEDLGALVRVGIASLKIEGRLKSPEYVAATVQSYRAALDQVFADELPADPKMDTRTREKLEMTFSRGFTGGYLHATDHQAVVEGRFPKKRGLFVGTVVSVSPRSAEVRIRLEGPLKAGDGVVFDAGRPDEDEIGGRVMCVEVSANRSDEAGLGEAVVQFDRERIELTGVLPGERVWKTSDPELDRELELSYGGAGFQFRRPVDAAVAGRVGEPLELTLVDDDGRRVVVRDTNPAEAATRRPLTSEVLIQQLGRLGGTPFELRRLTADLDGDLMVPFSRLNDLRRRAVELLVEARRASGTGRRVSPDALERMRRQSNGSLEDARGERAASDRVCLLEDAELGASAQVSVLCRTLAQVEAAAKHHGVSMIYVDFEDMRRLREAREMVPRGGQSTVGRSTPLLVPATLRIIKPGEIGFTRKLMECDPDAVLVRNHASWYALRREHPRLSLIADYSLNVANDLTASLLKVRGAFVQLTPSYDLNADQLLDLLRASHADWFEITIHQRLPMFHMEHCVFCRFLSTGTNHTNCGRPCDTHELRLRDRVGYEHPVKADAGCRNTVYNAVAQSGSEYIDALRDAGVRKFRIELLNETADETREVIDTYLPALRGDENGRGVWRKLRAASKLGVTRGSLDHE